MIPPAPPRAPAPDVPAVLRWTACLAAAACLHACSPAPPPGPGPVTTSTPTAAPTASEGPTSAPTVTEAPGPSTTATATSAPTSTAPAEGPVPDAACNSCLTGPVRWGWIGGNAAQRDRSTADPCRIYRRTRTFSARAGGAPPKSCSAPLACDASDSGAAKLDKLVRHADVQKALATTMTIYGCDMRPVDGTLYNVEVDGGRSLAVGSECKECGSGQAKCVPPPAAVKALVTYLQKLDETMVGTEPCKSVLGPS
jgi:hypothetical protein